MSGFLFDQLSDLKKNLIKSVEKTYPKETKQFLKKEAQKGTRYARQFAKLQIKKSPDKYEEYYHKDFRTGKVYKFSENDTCIKIYNRNWKARWLEYGHIKWIRGKNTGEKIEGKYIYKQVEEKLSREFENDCDNFLSQFIDNTINGK